MASSVGSVWIVEGCDETAYCDDGCVTSIVGIGPTEEIAQTLKELAEAKDLDFSYSIYEVELGKQLPFGEQNPEHGDKKRAARQQDASGNRTNGKVK